MQINIFIFLHIQQNCKYNLYLTQKQVLIETPAIILFGSLFQTTNPVIPGICWQLACPNIRSFFWNPEMLGSRPDMAQSFEDTQSYFAKVSFT